MRLLNQRVAGHDGTVLAHDAHVPDESSWPVPAVVTRTAYGRGVHLAEGRAWRRAGFALVAQDVRGRHDSDGVWHPYRGERADGAALVDHLLAQPWCDGRIVAHGGSYSGYTAWAMAVERPAAVRAVISLGASLGLHRTKSAPGGALRLAEHVGWWLERADGRTSRPGLRETLLAEDPTLLEHLPPAGIGERTGVHLPHLDEAVHQLAVHGREGHPPEALTGAELRALDCAALHGGGWYDLLAPEVVELWRTVGADVGPRPARRLVLGPWGHDLGMAGGTTTGVLDHGPGSRISWGRELVAWVRHALAGTATSSADVFRTGSAAWSSSADWPRTGEVLAWSASADGGLGATAATGEVGFAHDPHAPFPSFPAGADRTPSAARQDAARFTSAPLARPLVLEGLPEIDLLASTTATGTDWICRLLEQRPGGPLVELAVATTTAGPGTARTTAVFTPLSAELAVGSRLVLEVTSTDFPHLARHPGTEEDRWWAARLLPALQRVHCGPGATALRLPTGGAA